MQVTWIPSKHDGSIFILYILVLGWRTSLSTLPIPQHKLVHNYLASSSFIWLIWGHKFIQSCLLLGNHSVMSLNGGFKLMLYESYNTMNESLIEQVFYIEDKTVSSLQSTWPLSLKIKWQFRCKTCNLTLQIWTITVGILMYIKKGSIYETIPSN